MWILLINLALANPVFQTSNNGSVMKWQNFPVSIEIHESVPSKFHKGIEKASSNINKTLKFSIVSVKGKTKDQPSVDGRNIIYWVQPGSVHLPSNTHATTRVLNMPNGEIKDSDIFVSAENYEQKKCSNFLAVITHEMYHLLGLKHQEHGLMKETLSCNDSPTELNASDILEVLKVYDLTRLVQR